jgi:hypothetical protein
VCARKILHFQKLGLQADLSGFKIFTSNCFLFWVISGFRREVAVNYALEGHYEAISGNFLPTFRDKLSGPIFRDEESKRVLDP